MARVRQPGSSVHLWIPAEDVELQMSGYEGKVKELSFDHTSRWLATGAEGLLHLGLLGRRARGREPNMLPHDTKICAVAFQHDHGLLATASVDGVVRSGAPSENNHFAPGPMPAPATKLACLRDRLLAIGAKREFLRAQVRGVKVPGGFAVFHGFPRVRPSGISPCFSPGLFWNRPRSETSKAGRFPTKSSDGVTLTTVAHQAAHTGSRISTSLPMKTKQNFAELSMKPFPCAPMNFGRKRGTRRQATACWLHAEYELTPGRGVRRFPSMANESRIPRSFNASASSRSPTALNFT